MIVPDLNLLIYAVNEESRHHDDARLWFAAQKAWVAARSAATWALIDTWLDQPGCHPIDVGPRHYQVLKTLTIEHGTAGNLTTDAHLATICIDHNAVLYTADNDFARFTALRWRNPLK